MVDHNGKKKTLIKMRFTILIHRDFLDVQWLEPDLVAKEGGHKRKELLT